MITQLSMPLSFTVYGEPASKANSRRLVKFGTRPALIKSAKALSYIEAFQLQCPKLASPIEDDVAVWIRIWYATRRPDLDESVILDAMQGLVIANDRQVRERHAYWSLDRIRPRCTIIISALGESHPL